MGRDVTFEELASGILAAPRKGKRRLVALAGAPASGKSTLSERLVEHLNAQGCTSMVVPMDGFHLDNRILEPRGLLHRKGAPETFDLDGFRTLVARLPQARDVVYPLFDRSRDIAIAGAGLVPAECDTVVVEGNYLLLDAPGWRDLAEFWDVSVMLEVPLETLRCRLIQRWTDHGLSDAAALSRAETNDLPNAIQVLSSSAVSAIIYSAEP